MLEEEESRKSSVVTFPFQQTLMAIFIITLYGSNATADSNLTPNTSIEDVKTTWQLIGEKFRFRHFTEIMSPAFNGNATSIPGPNAGKAGPPNIFHIAWMDYEIAPNYRIVYWQRMILTLAETPSMGGFTFIPRNPRFALRRTQIFDIPNLNTTYDLYFQPGWAPESTAGSGKKFEIGFRTATSYSAPGSRWGFGAMTELTAGFFDPGGQGNDLYIWAMPWVSYDFNPTFSTQHWVTVPFAHQKGNSWSRFSWDDPGMPFIQNGVGVNISKVVWAAVFVNNYLMTTPTLQNTWASLWLSLTVL